MVYREIADGSPPRVEQHPVPTALPLPDQHKQGNFSDAAGTTSKVRAAVGIDDPMTGAKQGHVEAAISTQTKRAKICNVAQAVTTVESMEDEATAEAQAALTAAKS
eukprot:SAG31_NODE_36122_length_316_cov_0.894009_1_plen_105_part_11